MISFLLLVKLLASFVFADDQNDLLPLGQTKRVYYGENARIEDYPYFAGLGNCGAVILSNIWVATAAHCVSVPSEREPQLVYVGGNSINNSKAMPYTRIIIHPEYKEIDGISLNDIALLKLKTPLTFSKKIQPAKLPKTKNIPKNVVLVARGRDEFEEPSVELKKVDHIVLTPQECLSMMSPRTVSLAMKYRNAWNTMICSKRREDLPSVCDGDSGSPLLSGNTVVGLHTMGSAICHEGRLGIHTNILHFAPWIRSQTGL